MLGGLRKGDLEVMAEESRVVMNVPPLPVGLAHGFAHLDPSLADDGCGGKGDANAELARALHRERRDDVRALGEPSNRILAAPGWG